MRKLIFVAFLLQSCVVRQETCVPCGTCDFEAKRKADSLMHAFNAEQEIVRQRRDSVMEKQFEEYKIRSAEARVKLNSLLTYTERKLDSLHKRSNELSILADKIIATINFHPPYKRKAPRPKSFTQQIFEDMI